MHSGSVKLSPPQQPGVESKLEMSEESVEISEDSVEISDDSVEISRGFC